ncbi:hypothetical protein B0H17DRAFT_855500, partial [Mycena rosella]
KNNTEISHDLDIPLRVVQRVKQTWAELGEVCCDCRHCGALPFGLLDNGFTQFILAIIKHTPDVFLDEIQEALFTQHNIDVSLATICRSLHRMGISSKKLSRQTAERCENTRRNFFMEIGDKPVDRLVCADESAVNILTLYRCNGWS